jgi:hypothetical protein
MKRIFTIAMLALAFLVVPQTAFAKEEDPEPVVHHEEVPEEIQLLLDRIDEIKSMDRSTLSREEKKELRKELREMKKEVRSNRSGIFISTGAIIIILLLIIIL